VLECFSHVERGIGFGFSNATPDWELPFEVMCDVSDYAMGAVSGQKKDNQPYALYYVSRTVDEAQVNYARMEKEFLAVVFALEKFQSYVINSKVIAFTYHATLKALMKKSDYKPGLADRFFFFKSSFWRSKTTSGWQMWWQIIYPI